MPTLEGFEFKLREKHSLINEATQVNRGRIVSTQETTAIATPFHFEGMQGHLRFIDDVKALLEPNADGMIVDEIPLGTPPLQIFPYLDGRPAIVSTPTRLSLDFLVAEGDKIQVLRNTLAEINFCNARGIETNYYVRCLGSSRFDEDGMMVFQSRDLYRPGQDKPSPVILPDDKHRVGGWIKLLDRSEVTDFKG